MVRAGYLLIEMVIALALMATAILITAMLQNSILQWHQEAYQYMQATTIAQKSFTLLHKKKKLPKQNGFVVTATSFKPIHHLPFVIQTITVSFKTPRGMRKLEFRGGTLEKNS